MIADSAAKRGFRCIHVSRLGSTNDEALDRARHGDAGRLWIRADRQDRGRGRHNRPWSSPAGNLYVSLLLLDPGPMRQAPQLGLVAGLALHRALELVTSAGDALRIKWPNDVLWKGAKLAGILVEGTQTPQGQFAVVFGFGVNCLSHPPETPYATACLADFAQPVPQASDVLSALSETMVETLDLWDAGSNFALVREEWLQRALPVGSRLTVKGTSVDREGRFLTIDAQGRLLIETDVGPLAVEAADVVLTERL